MLHSLHAPPATLSEPVTSDSVLINSFAALGRGLTQLGTTLRGHSALPTFDVYCQLADSEISSRAASAALVLPGAYATGPQGPRSQFSRLAVAQFAAHISES